MIEQNLSMLTVNDGEKFYNFLRNRIDILCVNAIVNIPTYIRQCSKTYL